MVEQFLQAVDERLRGSPSYHQKLVLDGFEARWYIPRNQLSKFDLTKFDTGLSRIVIVPGSLVPETLPTMHRKKPDEVYVGYIKSR